MTITTHHRRAFLKPLALAGAVALLVLAAVLLMLPGKTLANPGALSGTVTDNATNEIANVLIEVIDGTNTVVASDTTDGNGDYSIPSLADATYTLRATPPAGSGFTVATILNVVVSGDTIRDIVLVPAVTSTYSGTMRNSDGEPVPNMRVRLRLGALNLESITGSDGAFSIEAAPDRYTLAIDGDVFGPAPDNARARWNFFNATSVDLSSGDVTEELSTGDVKLTVNVQDPLGAAVPDSLVTISSYTGQYAVGGRNYQFGSVTPRSSGTGADASVTYRLAPTRFNAVLSITVTPPSSGPGSELSAVTLPGLTLDAGVDKVVTITLLPPNTYSGTVRNSDGEPLSNMRVFLTNRNITLRSDTGSDGAFSFEAAPAQYSLRLDGDVFGPAPDFARARWRFSAGTVDLSSGDVTEELSTGDVKLTVNVQDPLGAAVPGSLVTMRESVVIGSYLSEYTIGGRTYTGRVNIPSQGRTGADGSVTYRLAPTQTATGFSIIVTPPSSGPGSELVVVTLPGQTLDAGVDKTVTITLVAPNTYSGTVRNSDGDPVPNMSVRLISGALLLESVTGSDGVFSIEAAPGQYSLELRGGVLGPAPDNAFANLRVQNAGTVDLSSGDVTEELSTGDVKLTVNVQDSLGAVVPDSLVKVSGYLLEYTFGGRTYSGSLGGSPQAGTGADGSVTYRLAPTLLARGFSVTITPPVGSGFVVFILPEVTLDQDRTITVVLQLVTAEDSDNDGIPNDQDNCGGIPNPGQEDFDGDGLGDACDPDDDNDGVSDDLDNCQFVANPGQEDFDGDGIGAACDPGDVGDSDGDGVLDADDNCPNDANAGQENNDGDALGDVCDPDDDNDGVLDVDDNCVFDANAGQEDAVHPGNGGDLCEDPDGDGVVDADDNCPDDANQGQEDAVHPGNGGDVCEDPDGDSVVDVDDNCPDDANAGQENNDGDALGDACDPDDDNDGVLDVDDNCVLDANPGQENNDGDALGDVCDPDDDNDGVLDVDDACPNTPGLAERQGCPVGDENLVDLHIVDQAKSGACDGGKGSCKEPITGAVVRVFDRNDSDFQTTYGTKNPSGIIYDQVWENDIGRVGACTTDASGECIAGEETTGDYLVIVKYVDAETGRTVYTGKPKSPGDFDATGLASKDFQVIKVLKKNGDIQFSGGKKTVVTGSYLEVVHPDLAIWEDVAAGYVYPFIFTSDSDWTVDVCAYVPEGYAIVGVYDENGDLLTDSSCTQTFVSGETKVAAFDVIEVGSPEPVLDVLLTVEHEGKVTEVDIEIPGERTYVEEPVAQPVWLVVAALAGVSAMVLGGVVIWRRRRA